MGCYGRVESCWWEIVKWRMRLCILDHDFIAHYLMTIDISNPACVYSFCAKGMDGACLMC